MTVKARFAALLSISAFTRNVGALTAGTVFAQGLMALSLPALTRIYSPEAFNLLAVYTAILSLIVVGSCLRFNIAISLPERDEDGMNLLALSLTSALAVSTVLALIVISVPDTLVGLLHQPGFAPYLWMVAPGVLLAAAYDALQYWASRKRRFGLITRTRLTRAVGGAGAQLGLGAVNPGPFGLILGHMIYGGLGVFGLLWSVCRQDRGLFSSVTPTAMRKNFTVYRRFPLYSVAEALLNTGGVQAPMIVIAATAAGPEAGFLMLAMMVMGLPMALIGSSVAQVYLAEAPRKLRDGVLTQFTRKAMISLFAVGGAPLLAAGLTAPFLFPIVFGAEWARAGWIVAWLTPCFMLQFIASPISVVLHVTGNLLTALVMQAFGFALRLGAVLAALWIARDHVVEVFAIAGAVFYAVYVLMVVLILRNEDARREKLTPECADETPIEA